MNSILEKKDIKKIIGIVAGAILFNWALQSVTTLYNFYKMLLRLMFPFILGVCIAFILNIPMRSLEKRMFIKKNAKLRRAVSLLFIILILLAIFLLALFIVIPEIKQTFETLSAMVPGFIDSIKVWIDQLANEIPDLGEWLSKMEFDWIKIRQNIFNFLQAGATSVLNSTVIIAASVFNGIFNFILGFVFAIYILFQKENLVRQTKKLFYAYLPEDKANKIISIFTLSSKTFSKFIAGQCAEAVILGLMFFITLTIFRFPYTIVIAVMVTCTAMIPIFGAFIACFIGALLILVTNPVKAFWFLVLFLVLQQIEGNVVYPRVVGNSIGLPALWVLLAVTIGGGIMGITGALISVPVCSVLYVLLRESVGERLNKKGK